MFDELEQIINNYIKGESVNSTLDDLIMEIEYQKQYAIESGKVNAE
jgi:hypothetical protein